ncbi:hypothetical protein GQ457_17G013180 [Hibiscus cannabinus]
MGNGDHRRVQQRWNKGTGAHPTISGGVLPRRQLIESQASIPVGFDSLYAWSLGRFLKLVEDDREVVTGRRWGFYLDCWLSIFSNFLTEKALENENGDSFEGEDELGHVAKEYFENLFASTGSSSYDRILNGVDLCITNEMNCELTREFSPEEIITAVKAMNPLKAAGEDGLGALFYQRFWHIIGKDVSDFCISVLKGEISMELINYTHIVLIPKNEDPKSMSHFRPISLCNVLFKLISKFLITFWGLWTARNKFLFEGLSQRPDDVATFVRSYCREMQILQDGMKSGIPRSTEWIAPNFPFVKINYDSSFRQDVFSACTGVVIRNHEGILMGACCKMISHIASSFAAEAQAAVHGLQLAADLGFQYVILEGDSMAVTERLRSEKEDLSEISAIIWDAKYLSRSFVTCRFQFTHREGNQVAHAVARGGSNSQTESIWVNEIPDHIVAMAMKERRSFGLIAIWFLLD